MKYFIIILLTISSISYADDFTEFDDAQIDTMEKNSLELYGFFKFEQGANISGTGVHRSGSSETNYVLANRKLRINAAKTNAKGGFFSKVDFFLDEVTDETILEIRELRLKYQLTNNIDLSVGKQVATWGAADMLFINDLFPKNWVANFTGQDMEMLKEPSDSVRLTNYFFGYALDFVYTPKFSPDKTPSGCRFGVYDLNTQSVISNKTNCSRSTSNLDNDVNNGELAVSLKTNFSGIDYAIYGYHGFYKSPKGLEFQNGQYVGIYPHLSVYGASIEGQVGPGIFTFETGYYDSRDDSDGNNPLIENSSLKYLFGYRMDLTSKFSFGIQAYQEKIQDYGNYKIAYQEFNPQGYSYRRKEISSTYTLRLNYKMIQETLNLSLFSYYRPDDHDSFTKIEVNKKVSTDFNFTVGANIFTGKDNYLDREFGMLRDDDNAYISLKYSF